MKTYKQNGSNGLFEIVIPFGGGIAGWNLPELHDDCPLCQDLEEKIRKGEVVEEQWEENGDAH